MESQNAFLTSKSRQKSLTIIEFYTQNPSKINENRKKIAKIDTNRSKSNKNYKKST